MRKLPNGLHPRYYIEAYHYLVPLSDLIRSSEGPIHRRALHHDRPALCFGTKIYIRYSVVSNMYTVYQWNGKILGDFYGQIELLLDLPYMLYAR